jgi:hypothetical protein
MTCVGAPGYPVRHVNGLEVKGDLDLILVDKQSSVRIGVEAKNLREWLYPHCQEIWECLTKCTDIEAVPVFVSRRLPYLTRLFFREVGALGFECYFQYFHPNLKERMAEMKHKDGLGFADIRFSLEPEERFVNFFRTTVPGHVKVYRDKFLSKIGILKKYAVELGKDIDSPKRRGLYNAFLEEAGLPGALRQGL